MFSDGFELFGAVKIPKSWLLPEQEPVAKLEKAGAEVNSAGGLWSTREQTMP